MERETVGAARWVLLHGFAGAPSSWDDVLAELRPAIPPIVPWLCGHSGERPITTAACGSGVDFTAEVARLGELVAVVPRNLGERCIVVGYSLGGRLALGLSLERPELFDAAVLVSTHPGLESERERSERCSTDERWALLLEQRGVEPFVAAWEAQPVFAGQERLASPVLERQRRVRLAHDPRALAGAMRALSLGRMPCYSDRLSSARLPMTWLAGERDLKFRALAEAAAPRSSRSRVEIVSGCGHNLPLEAPRELAASLQRSLSLLC